ncbi:DUF4082 domain-containing protein [Pontibacter sp. MBLB2868]|uniref:DUF4082 domain-containing protein n=1 Tax=Pontibacter sp. MBLB2868 TaxID=3451555 RepID=UPI003F74F997
MKSTFLVSWKQPLLVLFILSSFYVASAQLVVHQFKGLYFLASLTRVEPIKSMGSVSKMGSTQILNENRNKDVSQAPASKVLSEKLRKAIPLNAHTIIPTPAVSAGSSILVVSGTANKFSQYPSEILTAEGLNGFNTADISEITADILSSYDVVILGNIPLTDAQVTVFSNWTIAGGTLIALKPDSKLSSLMGLISVGGTLADKYLLVSQTGPGKGIVNQTIQYQGTADLYQLSGATKIATLYSGPTTSTSYPAVTINTVGDQGGSAVAFTYDLARSIVYTRQGNPAWSGQKRDGQIDPIRSDDQFYPDWIDLNKVAIPQADEQQRLLANIITLNSRKPMPRFWYMPRGLKAAVVMTGDDHGNGGTKARFNQYLQLSDDNSAEAVADWRAIRGTSYIYPNTPITDSEAKAFEQQGFEVALHLNTNCENFTLTSLEQNLTTQLSEFKSRFPSVASPTTNRTHCIAWSDWSTQPKLEVTKGIRLDANYYYWPSPWIQDRPGMFTGSGIPMRFTDMDGGLIDTYQLTTQMTDESDQTFPYTIDQLLNKALGQEGYYGIFCANMHTDAGTSSGSDAIIASAKARNVPVISSRQLLIWLDGRNGSTFNAMSWNGSELNFQVSVASGARNLQGMLPMTEKTGQLTNLTVNGSPVVVRREIIKGIEYAFFPCTTGNYVATYDISALPNQAPTVAITSPTNNSTFEAPGTITLVASVTDTDGAVASVEFYQGAVKLGQDTDGSNGWSFTWNNVDAGLYEITARATDNYGSVTISESVSISVAAVCPCTVFKTTDAPASDLVNDGQPVQLGMKFSSTVDGYVSGVRFYKQSGNTGSHIGQLYSITGTLLAEATFINETASGWQEVAFNNPVAIASGQIYIISYHSSDGNYSETDSYFNQAINRLPLRGLANGENGANGVYSYTTSPAFPTNTFQASNYWVDVVFSTDLPPNQLPSVAITSPITNAAFNAPASITIAATATDTDGSVAKVEFFQNSQKLGEDLTSPFSFTWNDVPSGNYDLTARVTDNRGDVVTSEAVSITVSALSGQNDIVAENSLPGNPESEWQITGAGDLSIQGFATDISYNKGETARFKIKTSASAYTVKIYRLGYYQGNGARYQGNATVTANLPQTQPNCLTNSSTGLIDCGNWAESASWAIPSNAVSGVYIAKLTRSGGGSSHIVFIVRDDAGTSDLLFQTSDATWQAYNVYGDNNNGKSLYTGSGGKAEKVSYNRPFVTRNGGGGGGAEEDWLFNAEYPMIRWLEANGFDVSYTTGVDSDRRGNLITKHKVFMSVGHDEYWSGTQRAYVTAARNSGTNLAFFSGNEVYWKTRWENSIDGSGTSHRTLVCYKEGSEGENTCNGKCDPTSEWTGLWRSGCEFTSQDPLACKPENELTGQISWAENTAPLEVPSTLKNLRFWRNTSVASLGNGQTASLTNGIIGYEWNPEQEQYRSSYPYGRIILSRTNVGGNIHNFSLYRHKSGAFVFGAGTVQYSWGLDSNHDRGNAAPSTALQQATINLLADMGAQPRSLQAGLVAASATTDTQAPGIVIASPAGGANLPAATLVTISGTASDAGVVAGVEVSTDGGTSWKVANGTSNWTYAWTPTSQGATTIQARAYDDSGNIGTPVTINVTVGEQGPSNCPCTVFQANEAPSGIVYNDNQGGIQLGMKFRTLVDGKISGVRFYKQSGNTGTHIGQLYSNSGNLLAEATFVNETASGWQEVAFSSPVNVTASVTYVVTYHSSSGYYSATNPFFNLAVDKNPLRALADGEDGPNGVYLYTNTPAFPINNFQSSNYWVDAVFNTSAPANQSPVVNGPIADQVATVGSAYSFTFAATTFTDVDADVLTYTASQSDGSPLPSWLSFDGANRTFTGIPATAGTLTLQVTADDGRGGRVSDEFALAVSAPANQSPVVNGPIADQVATVGSAYSFTFAATTFTDVDADVLTYTASQSDGSPLPSWLSFDGANRTFTGIPATAGTLTLQVTADDGRGGRVSDEFALAVSAPANQSPVLATIGNKSVNELTLLTFQVVATDDGLPNNTLTYSLIGAMASAKIDPVTGVFSWTPGELHGPGTYAFTIEVSDGALTDQETISIQVSEVNQAPLLATIGDKEVGIGGTLRFTLVGSDADIPAQILTYSANKLPTGASLNSTTGEFFWTPTNRQTGNYKINFRVTDGITQVSENVNIRVTSSPTTPAPAIFSFSPTSGSVGDQVLINGSNFTGVSTVLFNGSSASYTVNSASTITATVPGGATTGKLTVNTTNGSSTSTDVFTVISATNLIPKVAITAPASNASFDAPAVITITATVSDEDGTISKVEFFNGSTKIGEDLSSPYSYTWNNVAAGNYQISAIAYDNLNANSDPASVNINVINPSQTVPVVAGFSPASGNIGDVITISGSNLSGATSVAFNTTSATSFSVVSASSITATVPAGATTGKISVTTGGGTAFSMNDFIVTALTTQPPVIASFYPTKGAVGEPVLITGANLAGATNVSFGPSNAFYKYDNDGNIIATVPMVNGKLPSNVKISVTTSAGTNTTRDKFTITSATFAATSVSTLQKDGEQDAEALQVYPNPFSDKAIINVFVQHGSSYTLSLYDEKGELVKVLKEGDAVEGEHFTVEVDGSKLSKGLYLVRLQTSYGVSTSKLVLDK